MARQTTRTGEPTGGKPTRRRVLTAALATPALLAAPALLVSPARAAGLFGDSDRFGVAGLAPTPPAERALEATRKSFERALSRPVAVRHYRTGARLVDAVISGRAQCAVHTSMTYAASALMCDCAVPVLRPVARDGTAGVRAVLIVRRDGPVRGVDGLAGRTVLGASEGSVAGEVLRRGLRAPSGTRFDEGDAVARFAAGEGEALAGYEIIDRNGDALAAAHEGTLARLPEGGKGFAVLWRSFPIWHGPLAVSASLNAPLRRRLTTELVSLRPGGPSMQGLGLGNVRVLTVAKARDYAPLLTLMRGA